MPECIALTAMAHGLCRDKNAAELCKLLRSKERGDLDMNATLGFDDDIDNHQGTLLMRVCRVFDDETEGLAVAKLILEQENVNLAVTDNFNRTALWFAAFHGRASIVRLFIESHRPLPYTLKSLPVLVPKLNYDIGGNQHGMKRGDHNNSDPKKEKTDRMDEEKNLIKVAPPSPSSAPMPSRLVDQELFPSCTPQGAAERRGHHRVIELFEINDTPEHYDFHLPDISIKVAIRLTCITVLLCFFALNWIMKR